ncbi:sulfate anion transporter [Marasmius fiardii PR-910]|nr:sulfate anion transporter [Marasmius fiardii PR-910]
MKRRVKYYIPSTDWIPNYSLSLLAGDILSGITVASMLIPQSISYATSLAHLTPTAGLFSASIPPIIYALLGTSKQLNVAPEAALSLLVGQAVSDVHKTHQPSVLPIATVITLQVGIFSFLLGFFRLGFLDIVLSRALLRGFVAAIAVVIMIEQLIPMFGLVNLEHTLHPSSTIEKFLFLLKHAPESYHAPTTMVSFSTLLILILARTAKNRLKNYRYLGWIESLPEVLVVVVLSTILSSTFRWDHHGVDILGYVPINHGTFFESPFHHQTLKYLKRTTSTSVLIAVIGFLDSIVAAKQAALRYGYSVSPNRELVALGAANLAASFVPGTVPAFGSITRTRINGTAGARTQLSSMVCAGVILLVTFFLLPWLWFLPKCVLASVILLVVWGLMLEVPEEIGYFYRMNSYADLTLCLLTFFTSVIWNVEVGIVVSLIASLLLVIHRSGRVSMVILGRIPGTNQWKPINENSDVEDEEDGVLIVRVKEATLDFANTGKMKDRLRRLELFGPSVSSRTRSRPRPHPSDAPQRKDATIIIFHLADVEYVDAIAAQMWIEVVSGYSARGVKLLFTHVRPEVFDTFERAGLVEMVGREEGFKADVAEAMAAVGQDRIGTGLTSRAESDNSAHSGVREARR